MDADNIPDEIPDDLKKEYKTTRTFEQLTAKMPSGLLLALGAGTLALALAIKAAGRARTVSFIAQWVPTLLLMGLYNKLVTIEETDNRQLH